MTRCFCSNAPWARADSLSACEANESTDSAEGRER
jgi:hypothetical protein